MPELPPRILVVRLGAIGDVVNALVLATAIKDEAPRTHIGWAVHPLARPLVDGHPSVDRTHVWERGEGLAELRRLTREVRAERYDLAIDLQRLQKSAALARASGARRVLGYDKARAKELSWIWTRERIPPGDPRAHMVAQYLEFARYLGVANPSARRLLPPDDAAVAWSAERVLELGAAPVLLNLGASKPENRWPAERFGELAHLVARETGLPVAMTGGPGDREAAGEALRAAAGHDSSARMRPPLDLVGRTSLHELAALQRRARLVVTADTGPMHVAAAVGTPVVALFGPADPARTGPYGDGHVILRVPAWDEPGTGAGDRRHVRDACTDAIPVEMVLETVQEVLAR